MESYKTVYGYLENGEFADEMRARLCPVTKKDWIYPANTTDIKPPEPVEGHIRVFKGGAWEQVEDHRGKTLYSIDSKEKQEVPHKELGPLPEGFTDLEPFEFAVWDGKKWIEDVATKEQADRDRMAAHLKAYYKSRMINTVNYGGVQVQTDDLTIARIAAKREVLQKRPEGTTVRWRGVNGWHDVTLDTLDGLGMAIDAWVQGVFDALEAVEGNIENYDTTQELEAAFDAALSG